MKMIVGLGNPGAKYKNTKHNIGFIAVDEFAIQHKMEFSKTKFESLYAEAFVGTEKVLLVKPQTFMNDSGRAVRQLIDYFNVEVKDLVIIYDDLDLPVGKLRLRQKGSAGGHNGIKSIIQHIDTADFNRIRIGIDRPVGKQTVIQHVLSGFPKSQHEELLITIKDSVAALEYWIEGHPFLEVMNQFNKKKNA